MILLLMGYGNHKQKTFAHRALSCWQNRNVVPILGNYSSAFWEYVYLCRVPSNLV